MWPRRKQRNHPHHQHPEIRHPIAVHIAGGKLPVKSQFGGVVGEICNEMERLIAQRPGISIHRAQIDLVTFSAMKILDNIRPRRVDQSMRNRVERKDIRACATDQSIKALGAGKPV